MNKLVTSLILGISLSAFAHTAQAKSPRGYTTTLTSIPTSAIKLDVSLSEDLAFRANNLPDGRTTCSRSRGINNGFACEGYLGERDLEQLNNKLEKFTHAALTKRGITVSEDARAVLKLTLVDVKNNRPTFTQLSQQPGLSFQSLALGGAEIEGELFDNDGTSLGTVSYSYYDTFFDELTRSSITWTDATQALQRFSKRVAKDMAKHSQAKS